MSQYHHLTIIERERIFWCLFSDVDRSKIAIPFSRKSAEKESCLLSEKMIELLSSIPIPNKVVKTITPDRGKEFSNHFAVTEALNNVPFYFPDPHAPWQRGTNENTNGLIREYLPKSKEMDTVDDTTIYRMVEKLNSRPRKCLGWKTPCEVFFNKVLHLI